MKFWTVEEAEAAGLERVVVEAPTWIAARAIYRIFEKDEAFEYLWRTAIKPLEERPKGVPLLSMVNGELVRSDVKRAKRTPKRRKAAR